MLQKTEMKHLSISSTSLITAWKSLDNVKVLLITKKSYLIIQMKILTIKVAMIMKFVKMLLLTFLNTIPNNTVN